MTRMAIIGAGWRARFYWEIAARLDDLECVGVLTRSDRELPVPQLRTIEEVRRARPDFVVTSVPWSASPGLITEAVEAGLAVLAETPPAPELDGLRSLWNRVGASGRVQVAEQYPLLPTHAARLALVRSGAIGVPSQAQVSSTHQYHAIALLRAYLGVVPGPVTVRASATVGPLVDPLSRSGWTDDQQPKPARTVLATIDFGDDRSGLYDFTDNQWHNQLRFRRLLVRGSRGELRDDELVRLAAPRTIVRESLTRYQTGYDLNLDGFDTEHISRGDEILFRNPYSGQRWMDEEIAIATLLQATARWAEGDGPAPYPLAEGSHDHRIALAVDESLATDRPARIDAEPWFG